MYGGASRVYNQAMTMANGANVGTIKSMTANDAKKVSTPVRQFLTEL